MNPSIPPSLPALLQSLDAARHWHRRERNGKVARLPEPTRDLINRMIEDGLPYRAIIETLQRTNCLPLGLSEMNLSNWRRGGHQDWRMNNLKVAAGVRSPSRPESSNLKFIQEPESSMPQPPN